MLARAGTGSRRALVESLAIARRRWGLAGGLPHRLAATRKQGEVLSAGARDDGARNSQR